MQHQKSSGILIALLLLACGLAWVRDPFWPGVCFAVLSLAGIGICLSIILHLTGKDNTLTRQFCATEGKFNCDEVLERGRLGKHLSLADLGLIYFCTQFLFLWLGAATGSGAGALALLFAPAACAVAMTIGLLAWQAFAIGRWCRLCLLVTGVIWLQFAPVLWQFAATGWQTPGRNLPYILVASICLAGTWIIFKPWLATMEQNKSVRLMLNKWKKNTDFFSSLLQEQRLAVNRESWDDDLVLGDPQAPAQLICVMGTYCPVCAREYTHLSQLLRNPNLHVGVTIRFSLKTTNLLDRRALAAKKILDACLTYTDPADRIRLLRDWFRVMDLETWQQKWPVQLEPVERSLLDKHKQWCTQNKIRTTPVYFLNGREVPELYKLSDLSFHLSRGATAIKNLPE